MTTTDKDTKKQILLKESLIKAFFNLIRTAKIHHEGNKLIVKYAKDLILAVLRLGVEESVTIQFIGKRIYVQEKKLIYRPETSSLFDNMFCYFEARRLEGIRFHTSIKKATLQQLVTFARILNNAKFQEKPTVWFDTQLDENFLWAEIIYKSTAPTDGEKAVPEKKERAKKVYAHVLSSVQEVAEKISTQNSAGLSKARRVVQNMVDLIMEDEPLFKALSTVRIYDDYTYVHSVNVAILSMCIGKRIMLSQRSLEKLGLCGLLHDLGKIEVPKSILNKPGKLTDEEFEVMKRHSLISVRLITKIKAERDHKAQILLPPFEHHLKYDLSGYPQTKRKKEVSLFGRILTIADVYDAITSPRIYRPTSLSPDRALGFMLEGAGKDFDPILLKVFINMLGVYPVGTLLKLDKGIGLVTIPPDEIEKGKSNNSDKEGRRPWIVLLGSDGKKGVKKIKEVNLAERHPKTGKYLRNIIASFNPLDYGIQPVEFIL